MKHVFISYVHENRDVVLSLKNYLQIFGIDVWLDTENISVGSRWKSVINEAIQNGGVFIACFSKKYFTKSPSYVNEELILAIEELRKRPFNQTWFLPVLIEDCSIPDIPIGLGQTLNDIQRIDLKEQDFLNGIEILINTILPIVKPKTYWHHVLKTNLRYHIDNKIKHFTNIRASRFTEIEQKWQSLLSDQTLQPLSTAFFELEERAKDTNKYQFERHIESERTILLSFTPYIDTSTFVKELPIEGQDFSNRYLQFIFDNYRKLIQINGWEKRDLVHIAFFTDWKDTLFDIFYIINFELTSVITGFLIEKQNTIKTDEKYMISYEFMYPTSIINSIEASNFSSGLRREQAKIKYKDG